MLYYELSRYYLALPEEEVLASPDLMAALSMVCSVRLKEAYPGYLRRSAGAEQTRLTDRCLQVLRMQSMGLSRGEIAQQLNLSERSVKYQSEQAYRKLGVNNKIEAIETARRMHLL